MTDQFVGELIVCPLCASKDQETVATQGRNGSLTTVICRDCGLVFSNPMPTQAELDAFYRSRYRTEYKGTVRPKLKHTYRNGTRAIARFERLAEFGYKPGSGRVLDIGAGSGEFLYLMTRLGYAAQGIEPNQGYGSFCRDDLGLLVTIATLDHIDFEPASFDIISANHVVEHLRDPIASLRRTRNWLSPEGILVIEVPNAEATYHAPRTRFHFAHLYNFTVETLVETGKRAGFTPLNIELMPGTKHVNIAFRIGPESSNTSVDREHAGRTRARVLAHTPLRYLLTHHPYRRVVGNLIRPFREKLAIGSHRDARAVLDELYSPLLERRMR